jgi:hypothetical protein
VSQTLDDRYFDLTMKVLNYAMEFVNQPSYASLRMTDVLQSLIDISTEIEGIEKKEFYDSVKKKFRDRKLMAIKQAEIDFLNELLIFYIEEWRRRK